jgi:D-alanine-D-alanine ligase
MTSVVVLSGGTSDEREVSLRSGAAVVEALKQKGYEVTSADPADGFEKLAPVLKACDVVFLALHGKSGEDGTLQHQLEELGVSYVGSDSQASTLCFDKWEYSKLLEARNIPTPITELVDEDGFAQSKMIREPFVLKPNDGGSSIDTFIVRNPASFQLATTHDTFRRHSEMLLQVLVEGTEITIGMLGNEPLPVIEIVPPADQEFDYANKYNGKTQELCPPKHVSAEVQQEAQALAHRIHQLCDCRDMSRTDMLIRPDNSLCVLETNTIPGLTNQSLLPKAAAVAGYDMPTLVDKLVQAALHRSGKTSS